MKGGGSSNQDIGAYLCIYVFVDSAVVGSYMYCLSGSVKIS